MLRRLDNKAAIVTGAGRGIGTGISNVLAREGAKILVVDIVKDLAKKTAERIQSTGGVAFEFQADVTKYKDMERMALFAIEKFGRIDILCQNVGVYPSVSIEEMTEADWDKVLEVNLKSGFLSVKACLEQMKKQRYGKIVMTSSITGPRTAIPGLAHYAAAKSGINGFIKVAALEFAKYGITINGVEPGTVLTEGLQGLGPQFVREAEKRIPLGRLAMPEDIGNVVLFLASDESSYITGQTIIVDGGQTLPE
jgi:3-oxoacyl-[acyl-carrier protein] reductase